MSSDESIEKPPGPVEDDAALRRARRAGGPRVNVSETVAFHGGGRCIEGWALNMSQGGLRAILEESVDVEQTFDVVIGEEAPPRPARVVWVRQEKDGAIVGVAFLDVEDGNAPAPLSQIPELDAASSDADEHDTDPDD